MSTVPAKLNRSVLVLPVLLAMAGCNKTDTAGTLAAGGAPAPTPAVIQGACPQAYINDTAAVYTTYSKPGSSDPNDLVRQASLVDITRQCVQTENQLLVTVVAQGRAVEGPAGGAGGTITLPIRVQATDGDKSLYSETVNFPVQLAPNSAATQFIFTKASIPLPGGAGSFTKVTIGFDTAPKAVAAKSKRRK
ncbi:hypothetical protein BJF93_17615 [Xaviernesmea oryzae]|uniref:Lipoprotein n=1 Tax=Xaviernesmea oryzae TaxID=464029 RepID=A0A1Q9ATK8_9HYPH|nr:hypothetical protein [Xaviernesmea oryzae]OLP58655.1 hypothetical protein BJF93_17615 [Xaviernesmea oryzae]SEK65843.1 hypothetical protein SAMN04487976_103229 [Xaviernesmea oryzae]